MSESAGPQPTSVGYAEALAELDTILRELESSDVDVDHLAERVARAATLITLCRERIASARLQIEQVIADLEGDEGGAGADQGDAGGGGGA